MQECTYLDKNLKINAQSMIIDYHRVYPCHKLDLKYNNIMVRSCVYIYLINIYFTEHKMSFLAAIMH